MGKKSLPDLTRAQVTRVLRELLPRRTWTDAELWCWLLDTQDRNRSAKSSHAKRRILALRKLSL